MVSVGQPAPEFELLNQFGQTVRLSQLVQRGPVCVAFVPLAFSGTCSQEFVALRENAALIAAHGVTLVGVSVDSKFTLRAWDESHRFGFDLLSDFWPHGAVASSYGVFSDARGTADRHTFVIGADGVLVSRFAANPGEGRHIDQYAQAFRALR